MRTKKSPALGDIAAHTEALQATHGRDTNRSYALAELRRTAGHLEPRQLNALIPHGMVARWRTENAKSTAYQRRNALQRILRHLEKFGAPHIDLPRIPPPRARAVTATREEITALLANAKPHMRLFVLLCWQTALRFSEAHAVSTSAWDRENETITMTAKGGDKRTIPVTPEIGELLAAAAQCAAPGQSAIAALNGTPNYGKLALRQAWKNLKKKAGLAASAANPHDLRRTTATNLYAICKDLRAVQQYLGHVNMSSTVHYIAPLNQTELRSYQELLSFHKFNSQVKQ